ncbi:MAG: MFS transporter [Gordonia polyisoprenivorans]|nr:MFS transporter [Gordonia polyisoprenivorans]
MTETKSGPPAAEPAKPGAARRVAHPALVLLVIAGAQMMVVLDATIVNIALPSMGDYFDKSQTDMTWALNAYTLAFGGLLLLGGRSGDLFGRRKMFAIGLGLFTLGSFLGGIAPTYELMLFGRVVQGIGGAIASPTALSLITTEFEEGEARTRAFAVYAAVSGGGAALGLLLGGILTEFLNWRWVLFVNVPIGAALIVGALTYLHESERHRGRIDVLGALLSVVGMVGVVYGFINAANHGWSNGTTIGVFSAAIVLLVAFVLWEIHTDDPMLPLGVILDRNRGGGYLVMLIVGAAMFGLFYFVTFFVQQVVGFSALEAGFAFLPVAFVIGITSQLMTKLMPKFGPKVLIVVGSTLLTLAMFWYSTVDAGSGYWDKLFPGMIIQAIGMGFIFVPLTTVAVSKVKNTEAGVASAMLNVGQQVGGSIGLSVLATIAATAGRNYATDNIGEVLAKAPASDRGAIAQFLQSSGSSGPEQDQVKAFIADHPRSGEFFAGPYHDFANSLQAHSSGEGFLAAGFFGVAAIVVALILINVKKDDVPSEPPVGVGAA